MLLKQVVLFVLVLVIVAGMAGNRNETRRSNRQQKKKAQQALKRRLAEAKVENDRLERIRNNNKKQRTNACRKKAKAA